MSAVSETITAAANTTYNRKRLATHSFEDDELDNDGHHNNGLIDGSAKRRRVDDLLVTATDCTGVRTGAEQRITPGAMDLASDDNASATSADEDDDHYDNHHQQQLIHNHRNHRNHHHHQLEPTNFERRQAHETDALAASLAAP